MHSNIEPQSIKNFSNSKVNVNFYKQNTVTSDKPEKKRPNKPKEKETSSKPKTQQNIISARDGGSRLCSNMHTSFVWDYEDVDFLNPSYQKLIDILEISSETLSFLRSGVREYVCDNFPGHRPFYPMFHNGKYHPWASQKHTNRVMSKVLPKFNFMREYVNSYAGDIAVGGHRSDYITFFTLTIPNKRKYIECPDVIVQKLKDAAKDYLVQLKNVLFPVKWSQLGGLYAIHPWKSNSPLEPHFHIHLFLFNVAMSTFEFSCNRLTRFAPLLDAQKVKLAWRMSLEKVGLWDSKSGDLPVVHLKYVKLTDVPQLIHQVKYAFRKPIADLNKNLKPYDLKKFTDSPKKEIYKSWAKWLLNYTPSQRFIGFCKSFQKLGYNHNFRWFADADMPSLYSRRSCPLCGGRLRPGKILDKPPPGTPVYYLDKDRNFVLKSLEYV